MILAVTNAVFVIAWRGLGKFNSVENYKPPCAIAKTAFITARFHLISYLQFNILFARGS